MAFPDPSGFPGHLSFVSEGPMELCAQLRYEVPLEKVEAAIFKRRGRTLGDLFCVCCFCVLLSCFVSLGLVWLKVARERRVLRMYCP